MIWTKESPMLVDSFILMYQKFNQRKREDEEFFFSQTWKKPDGTDINLKQKTYEQYESKVMLFDWNEDNSEVITDIHLISTSTNASRCPS